VLYLFTLLAPQPAGAQTNAVTGGNGVNYIINGANDPTLTLQRGVLYVFTFSNIGGHPFWIKSSLGSLSAGRYDVGVTNNGFQSGALFFAVATNAPNQLFYQCGAHSSMAGTLNIITPAAPTPRIVHVNIGSFITVRSTGTNAWRAVPEFKCSLSEPGWSPVANFTNAYATGTNTTTFSRLDSFCGSSNVFLRIRNQTN
jgi:hypothetical protein